MARITVEDCLNSENNRFALCVLAARRTKQIHEGAQPLIENSKNKPVVTALREIADGKVSFMTDEELQAEIEKEEAERAAKIEEMSAAPVITAETTESSEQPAEQPVEQIQNVEPESIN